MRYCTVCVLPETRPNLKFDESGRCNCFFSETVKIDWTLRKTELRKLVSWAKETRNGNYDVVIPVSGGKDSTWQALTARGLGLSCLLVTWKTPFRTDLGRANLESLISLGFDHFDVSLNRQFDKEFMLTSFEKAGSPAVPMHLALHAIPVRVAQLLNIPLILWGEDSASQYGGQKQDQNKPLLSREWHEKYSATAGTGVDFWVDQGLPLRDLFWYSKPEYNPGTLREAFLGYYLRWDAKETARFSSEHGFQSSDSPVVGVDSSSDLDDDVIMPIHHWMKWPKFGFTRAWDNYSHEIREGRLSREKAIDNLRKLGSEPPVEAIKKFCDYVGIGERKFWEIVEIHRNKEIWHSSQNNVWQIPGFLIEGWDSW